MANIITSILEIDQKATDKLLEAEKQKNQIIANAKLEEERLINEKVSATDLKIKELEEEEQIKFDQKLVELEKTKEAEIKSLDTSYQANHTLWGNDIFENIINA